MEYSPAKRSPPPNSLQATAHNVDSNSGTQWSLYVPARHCVNLITVGPVVVTITLLCSLYCMRDCYYCWWRYLK